MMKTTLEGAKVRKNCKKKKSKSHRVKITFSSADKKMIDRYCKINQVSPAIALRRIVRSHLKEVLSEVHEEAENQLSLFDPVQRTIFDV